METLNLDQLRAFVDVVELGSFSAAADRRRLSQPAVSLQVRQLEKRLGVKLIERVGRRAMPTPAGTDLLQHAGHIDAAVSAALQDLGRHTSGGAGRVRLGTGATACMHLLPPVLVRLRRAFPDLDIAVRTGDTPDIAKAVEENRLDVGFVTLPVSGRMLDVTPVLDDELVAIERTAPTRGAHIDPLPARVTADALARRTLLLYESGGRTRSLVDAWFERAGHRLVPSMSLGSVEAIKELVAAGLGCAVLPRMAMKPAESTRTLVVRSLSPVLSRTLAIIVRRDKPLSWALRETIAALSQCAATGGAAKRTSTRR
ncbi:LysR family transcriptional regulator [Paraburkholderia flava]|uniref:LysR family transcriptional regulator n=1 Tax=Paraburkholderia flava TaxID=2547393 RepID=UPI00105CC54B|nr:LysR family transcriptional regulator [Paraburkholderia flava]